MTTTPTPKLFMWRGKDAGKNTGKIMAGTSTSSLKYDGNQQQEAIYGVFDVPSHYSYYEGSIIYSYYEGMDSLQVVVPMEHPYKFSSMCFI